MRRFLAASAALAWALVGPTHVSAQVNWTVCDVGLGGSPVAIAAADFNRDGNPDLAVVNQSASQVNVLLTNPLAFRMLNCAGAVMRADVTVGASPVAIAAGNLDANLTIDLAVATAVGISILRSNDAGVFTAQTPIPGGADPRAVAIADVNGDARADIIVGNGSGNSITILLGAAQNEFSITTAIVLSTGAPISFLIARDLDLDSEPDIAAGSTLSGQLQMFLHDSGATNMFRSVQTIDVGTAPTSITAADLSRDAAPDLAVVGGGVAGALRVFLSQLPDSENPAFALIDMESPIGGRPSSVAAGNIDSDFDPDLVVANQDDDTVEFFFGVGDGTVAPGAVNCSVGGTLCEVGAMPRAVTLADVDADGRLDVVTANQGEAPVAGSLTFLLSSAPGTPTPTEPPTAAATRTFTPTPSITHTPTPSPTRTITPTPLPTTSDCFIPRATPGCDQNPQCEVCVCGVDSFCCDEINGVWDLRCVEVATGSCADDCGFATPTIANTPTITRTATRTATATASETETPTITGTRPRTFTPSPTPTGTLSTPTPTPTITLTPTITPTRTHTPTQRPTSTPQCIGTGMNQICTSGDTCAIVPNPERSMRALLVLLPGLIGLALRRLR